VDSPRPSNLSAEYNRWWKKLSKDERKTLIESGAFRADEPSNATPNDSRSSVNGGHFDFSRAEDEKTYANTHAAGSLKNNTPTPPETLIALEDAPAMQRFEVAALRLRATLFFLLEGLDKSTDPAMRLHADIIRIVVGEGQPPRMKDLASRHGLSRAAISLRCRKLLRRLGLEPSRFMRPEQAVASMKFSRIMRHVTGQHVSIGGVRRPKSLSLDSPRKESFKHPPQSHAKSDLRKIETKGLDFRKGKGKPRPTGSPHG
jgi:hypothetical protein